MMFGERYSATVSCDARPARVLALGSRQPTPVCVRVAGGRANQGPLVPNLEDVGFEVLYRRQQGPHGEEVVDHKAEIRRCGARLCDACHRRRVALPCADTRDVGSLGAAD